ncbi:Serine-aspartate repeat-containing protein D precursor [Crateriforma conspicua]|nr:SdrD B-like domain-containing protein [Crateriforma conspicua]QDV63488.1 Serine-aspartate repeat-containing protein D precursor [Crateriforma conspicua]
MIWKRKRKKRTASTPANGSRAAVSRRGLHPERLESRRLMAADPIHVGVVYLETDYLESDQDVGSDSRGDRFILSFTGGAPGTELTELRINTDKYGDGVSIGDPIFDTAIGGLGKNGAHDFEIVKIETADGRVATAQAFVEDGGQELILRLTNFQAGDRLEFTMDVDEVLRQSSDLDTFNAGLDVITSGQEFQDSILEATFNAPHYETSVADALFVNDFGDPASSHGLDLPPDEGTHIDSRPNRSAAAVGTTVQTPKPVSISGYVWVDNDLDLKRESGERVLEGVEIALYQKQGNSFVDTGLRAVTGADGHYEFAKSLGLMPGEYKVVQAQPDGLFSVGAVLGQVEGQTVGNVENVNSMSNILIVDGDTEAILYDFAEADPASVSGFVYRDDNDNGRRDPGEVPLSGIRVQLIPVDTIAAQSGLIATTNAAGAYQFTGLAPGNYQIIQLDQPVDLQDGTDAAGTIDGIVVGSAVNPGDSIVGVQLDGGDDGIEYNFGELPLGSLSGYVYLLGPGQDCDGIREAEGNTPLQDVEIILETMDGQFIAQTVTDVDGRYFFDDLTKGQYRIREITPDGLIDGSSHVGRIGTVTVGNSIDGGLIQDIVMIAGGHGTEYNFCEAAPADISGYVYHDASNDGQRDASETGIAGTRLDLVDSSGNVIATTTTDANGFYRFADILPGDYTIREHQPDGFYDGKDSVGTIRGTHVGQLGGDGDSLAAIELKQGDLGVEYNFGELLPASLAGRVHVDLDEDCELDPGEPMLEGVVIRLLDASGNEIAMTTTDADGNYKFDNLVPGRYTVIEETPAGYFEGGSKPGSAGGLSDGPNRIGQVDLASGEVAVNYDFCERPPAEISGYVYNDADGDCVFDPQEIGIDGVTVELYDADGNLVATTQTDASGHYSFTHLQAGMYTVREIQPAGWLQGGQQAGSAGGDDSVQDTISSVPISWGDRLIQYNFCELEPSSLAGTVYVDRDGDCFQDDDEPPLQGVRIDLLDADGRIVMTTTTDADGNYRFTNLRHGTYQVIEHQPEGYFQGGQMLGSGGGQILGDDHMAVDIGIGKDLTDYDFCELPPSSLSGTVYVDADRDCVYDPEEDPLAGVRVDLIDEAGNIVATTTTDADGNYQFDNLAPGTYQIIEHQPDGYYQGGQKLGSGGGTILGQDHMSVDVMAGVELVDYDFCEQLPASLSGYVWSDQDLDRQFDGDELALSGVVVEIIDAEGQVAGRTTTNASGYYQFTDLAPGVYSVREFQPEGYFHGGETVGSHGGTVGGDDLIVAVELRGGDDAVQYNFPEVPPATISGYVFQDGDSLKLQFVPSAEDLRDYRDGMFTADDTPLSGVTLELRNVLGQIFTSDRMLPGIYDDGLVRITTDANGYYEFTGLRPGTYHVYQVQPDDYIDALDTPGSTGGVAINPADVIVDQAALITFQTLSANEATDPGSDAILNVTVAAGETSASNNFSEILVDPTLPPPLTENAESIPEVVAPIETFDRPIRLVGYAAPYTVRTLALHPIEWAVSWHLSVINAGFPRGENAGSGIVRTAGAEFNDPAWTEGEYAAGTWSAMSGDGVNLLSGVNLGGGDAIALTGDFNGDGIDETAIYVAGRWYIDLNGNGVWDEGDLWVQLGTKYDRPVVGDWDGDGKDDVGIFGRQWNRDPQRVEIDPGLPDPANRRRTEVDIARLAAARMLEETEDHDQQRLLRRGNRGDLRADEVDHVFKYGEHVDQPVVGDWNGDGIDQIAVFRSGQWLLDDNGDGRWTSKDHPIEFGKSGDEPVVGDFNGDGIDEIAVVRGDTWIIDTDGDRRLTANDQRIVVPRGSADSQPVTGDFDGDGKDEPGYYDEAS